MFKTLRRAATPLALSALLLATACSNGTTGTPGGAADQLDVVVGFYPLQFVAERVGGPDAKVTNLTQPGAEAHDVELTPRQIAALGEADLVIHIKGFQPALDEAIAQVKPKHVLDIATVVPMHGVDAAGGHDHDHAADEHGPATPAPEESHSADDGHDHSAGLDPHVWLDPTNMVTITDRTAKAMGEATPERQPAYTTNASALTAELTGLDERYRTGLQTCERREFVTSHAAFGYLADRYKLTEIAIRGLSPDAEPSPARIAEVQQLAREHGVTTIFYETLVSPAVAEAIAGDLKLRTDVLDPLEGLSEKSRGKNYVEVMDGNLAALKAANQCQ